MFWCWWVLVVIKQSMSLFHSFHFILLGSAVHPAVLIGVALVPKMTDMHGAIPRKLSSTVLWDLVSLSTVLTSQKTRCFSCSACWYHLLNCFIMQVIVSDFSNSWGLWVWVGLGEPAVCICLLAVNVCYVMLFYCLYLFYFVSLCMMPSKMRCCISRGCPAKKFNFIFQFHVKPAKDWWWI